MRGPPAGSWSGAAEPPALRHLPAFFFQGAAPSLRPVPPPPGAITCGEEAGRSGSAPPRPQAGLSRGENSPAAAVTARAAPAGRARNPAAAQRGASPAGRRQEGKEGEERRGEEPARRSRPVPSPGWAAAATASEGRARRARRQQPPPPPGHRRGSCSAPSSRPPRALSSRQPPSGRWVGLGLFFFFLPPPQLLSFSLSRRTSPAPFLPPLVTPPAATRAVSWTALLGSANRGGGGETLPPHGPARRGAVRGPPDTPGPAAGSAPPTLGGSSGAMAGRHPTPHKRYQLNSFPRTKKPQKNSPKVLFLAQNSWLVPAREGEWMAPPQKTHPWFWSFSAQSLISTAP